jgi:hypothetical protein
MKKQFNLAEELKKEILQRRIESRLIRRTDKFNLQTNFLN